MKNEGGTEVEEGGLRPLLVPEDNGLTRFLASVSGYKVTLDLDADGRMNYVTCECRDFKFNLLRKGPCAHILAVTILAAQRSGQVEQKVEEESRR